MASLVVRKLDDDLVATLKARAKRHGRSAEAEHRVILQQALRPARTGKELWEWSRQYAATGPEEDVDFTSLADETPDIPDLR